MRALIINLAVARERMAFQRGQLLALGILWERIEAVMPDTLPVPAENPCWRRWERPLRATEAATLLSHRAAWERVAREDKPMLVLEDDAVLAGGTAGFLEMAASVDDADHVTLETRGRRKLLGRRHESLPARRLYQDRTGAAAYALWPEGARRLLRRATRRPALADAIICAAYELRSWQAVPALAVQADMCGRYGIQAPIETVSSISGKTVSRGTGVHRLRRAAAQVRMGWRRFVKMGGGEWLEVGISDKH